MPRILLTPSSPLSLHDAPRAGELVATGSRTRPTVFKLDGERVSRRTVERLRREDEREQQTIADAAERARS